MPCDTKLEQGQSITERKREIKNATDALNKGLASGRIRPKISPKGGIVFEGWDANERKRITDGCAYRRIMVEGSALAKMAIQRAEALAGRQVDKQAIGQGLHSHDGGQTWHDHKG